MKQYSAEVITNRKLCSSLYQVDFILDGCKELPFPGQFFSVRITDSLVPLLRRPFAFSAFDPSRCQASCVYQVRGIGTRLLSSVSASAILDIIAPLGVPFPLPGDNQKPVLVAGGIGLGPLLFLADAITEKGLEFDLIFGCRSVEYFPESLFGGMKVVLCTDDGSAGFHGSVIDYLSAMGLPEHNNRVLYCCGPHPMLKACNGFSLRHRLDCYVSVEQVMACGVGACMGCAVKVRRPEQFVRACKEGPVFNSRDIVWEE
jgi:dihydroorotate dehydrogenase electron transfer subunit